MPLTITPLVGPRGSPGAQGPQGPPGAPGPGTPCIVLYGRVRFGGSLVGECELRFPEAGNKDCLLFSNTSEDLARNGAVFVHVSTQPGSGYLVRVHTRRVLEGDFKVRVVVLLRPPILET